jgi:hypothetical protein
MSGTSSEFALTRPREPAQLAGAHVRGREFKAAGTPDALAGKAQIEPNATNRKDFSGIRRDVANPR